MNCVNCFLGATVNNQLTWFLKLGLGNYCSLFIHSTKRNKVETFLSWKEEIQSAVEKEKKPDTHAKKRYTIGIKKKEWENWMLQEFKQNQ